MQKIYLLFGLILAVILNSCASPKDYKSRTGFFNSYSGLEESKQTDSFLFEQMKDVNLSAYNKILIPDIKVLSNTLFSTPSENRLHIQASAYTSAAYRKNIIKNSSNYEVVDVPQKETMVIEISISMIEVHPEDKEWDGLSALAFSLNPSTYAAYEEGNVRLMIEAKITDAMSEKLLARSIHVIKDKEVKLHTAYKLQFKDFQDALDSWLNEALIKR